MKLTHTLFRLVTASVLGRGAAQVTIDADFSRAALTHQDYGGRIYTAVSGSETVLRTENKRWHVWWTQPMTWPAGLEEGDVVTLSFGVRVTNPGESFLGSRTADRVVENQADLCQLVLRYPGGAFSQFLQPSDTPVRHVTGTFAVPADTSTPLVLNFEQNCDWSILARAADFEISRLRAEVQLLRSSTTTTQESTTETSTTSTEVSSTETSTITTTTEDSSTEGPSSTSSTLTPSSTSLPPSTSPQPEPTSPSLSIPRIIGRHLAMGCIGSSDGYVGFALVASRADMDLDLCVSLCEGSGKLFSGAHDNDCYCGDSVAVGDFTEVDETSCHVACPGNPSQRCGGLSGVTRRDLETRQSPPVSIFLTIYALIIDGSLSTLSVTQTITSTITTVTTISGSTLPVTATVTAIKPHVPQIPDWWSCQKERCAWDVWVLKPQMCSGTCGDGFYYELICNGCAPGEEYWAPIKCRDGSCRDKTICIAEMCKGGFCGDYPVVKQEMCDKCEGGFVYRPQPRTGGSGAGSGKSGLPSGSRISEHGSGYGRKQDGKTYINGEDGTTTGGGVGSGVSVDTGEKPQGPDHGFVTVSGTYMSAVDSLLLIVMGLAAVLA